MKLSKLYLFVVVTILGGAFALVRVRAQTQPHAWAFDADGTERASLEGLVAREQEIARTVEALAARAKRERGLPASVRIVPRLDLGGWLEVETAPVATNGG